MLGANTFGTFLDTFKRLESGPSSIPQQNRQGNDWSSEVFRLATTLSRVDGKMPVKTAMVEANLPKDTFFNVLVAGREKGIFEVDEQADQPVVSLTKLGRTLVE